MPDSLAIADVALKFYEVHPALYGKTSNNITVHTTINIDCVKMAHTHHHESTLYSVRGLTWSVCLSVRLSVTLSAN